MPRDLSGNYTLPAGNPVSSGGVISSVWANSTLSDLANEMGNSLAKDGRTPITGPFKFVSGTSALPGITFSTDPGTGLWLPATGILAFSTGAFERMRIDTTGKVGIGTSSPAFGLDVNASVIALGTKTASSTNGGYVRYRDDTGAVRWAAGVLWPAGETSFSIYDAIAGSSRLVIDSAGRVGIG